MKQVTQKEVLETIEAKRQSAENAYVRAHISGSRAEVEKNKNYMDAYQDALCYIASVEIVPDTLCPTCKDFETCYQRQRSGKNAIKCTEYNPPIKVDGNIVERKIDTNKIPITPYNEPKVEPLINDRFRDFKKSNDCNDFYVSIDAKDVNTITMTYEKNYKTISIYVNDYCVKSVVNEINEQECLAFYKDLVEWRNYWKQN